LELSHAREAYIEEIGRNEAQISCRAYASDGRDESRYA
jgi:hypothetical protein